MAENMSGWAGAVALNAKPGTKLAKQLAKKPKTAAEKLHGKIKYQERKVAQIEKHVAWCAEHGQMAEVERWTPWIAAMKQWIEDQNKKLEVM